MQSATCAEGTIVITLCRALENGAERPGQLAASACTASHRGSHHHIIMLSQYPDHAPKQVRDGLPAEAQALQLHLICEELESRDDLTMSSPAAVRCRHPLWLQCRRQSRWLATERCAFSCIGCAASGCADGAADPRSRRRSRCRSHSCSRRHICSHRRARRRSGVRQSPGRCAKGGERNHRPIY